MVASREELKSHNIILLFFGWPLAWLYRRAINLRNHLYQKKWLPSNQLPGITISIGNIEVGGTGKSPIVIAIAQYLLSSGHKPAILSRGYRSGLRKNDNMTLIGNETIVPPLKDGHYFPDESRMQANILKTVPVIIGANRLAAARRYLLKHDPPTHWILDDGFQHRKIDRHLDIVLLDAKAPFHNNWVFPLGRLREPPEAIKRADIIFFTKGEQTLPTSDNILAVQKYGKPWLSIKFIQGTPYQVTGPSTSFFDIKRVTLASAIAKVEPLAHHISEDLGLEITNRYILRDHQRLRHDTLSALAKITEAILTTAKDFWRDPTVFHDQKTPVYIVPLMANLSHPQLK